MRSAPTKRTERVLQDEPARIGLENRLVGNAPQAGGEFIVEEIVTLQLEEDAVRFTPDGRIAVVDAIGALSQSDCPKCLWENLKRHNPELHELYGHYSFPEEDEVAVADSQSWVIIQTRLLDHLIEAESP